ncbi:unnamed protein product, partial [Brenthis ino]
MYVRVSNKRTDNDYKFGLSTRSWIRFHYQTTLLRFGLLGFINAGAPPTAGVQAPLPINTPRESPKSYEHARIQPISPDRFPHMTNCKTVISDRCLCCFPTKIHCLVISRAGATSGMRRVA